MIRVIEDIRHQNITSNWNMITVLPLTLLSVQLYFREMSCFFYVDLEDFSD